MISHIFQKLIQPNTDTRNTNSDKYLHMKTPILKTYMTSFLPSYRLPCDSNSVDSMGRLVSLWYSYLKFIKFVEEQDNYIFF